MEQIKKRYDFAVRFDGGPDDVGGMTFEGVGVPYNETIRMWGGRERFAPGSVTLHEGAPVLWQHDPTSPIGTITEGRDTPEGFVIAGQLSDTQSARDAWTLLRDGVVVKLSIGFTPIRHDVDMTDPDDPLVTHTEVDAREFSLVTFPAYEGARVTSHRSLHMKEIIMNDADAATVTLDATDLTQVRAEVADLGEAVTDLTRLVRLGAAPAAPAAPAYRSAGEWLKRVAAGDDAALDLHEQINKRWDETSAGLAQNIDIPTALRDLVRLATSRRRLVGIFGTTTLPATGMRLDYVRLDADETKVAKQAAEGADLVKGRVSLTTASAAIDTYGGWTELSRQVIERASVNHLTVTLQALALRYGRETERAFGAALAPVVQAAPAVATLGATRSWRDWVAALVDVAAAYDDEGLYTMQGALVSKDIFKELATLETDTGEPLMHTSGPVSNQVGTVDGSLLGGSLVGVKIEMLPATITGADLVTYDTVAASWAESSNAPLQLQDENIVNLSKAYSLYGYGAAEIAFPGALKRVAAPTA